MSEIHAERDPVYLWACDTRERQERSPTISWSTNLRFPLSGRREAVTLRLDHRRAQLQMVSVTRKKVQNLTAGCARSSHSLCLENKILAYEKDNISTL